MKKEVDGVVVEAKSILTALKIIKTVCEDNDCPTCPFANNDSFCLIKGMTPWCYGICACIVPKQVAEVQKWLAD